MTDSNLRQLERAFRASGSVEDEAAWLLERVRRGDVSPQRAEVVQLCGHPAACGVEATTRAVTQDLVRVLRVSKNTIKRWSEEGLPREKVGAAWTFEVLTVFRWLAEHESDDTQSLKRLVRLGGLIAPAFGVRAACAAAASALERDATELAILRAPFAALEDLVLAPTPEGSERGLDVAFEAAHGLGSGAVVNLCMAFGNLCGSLSEPGDLPLFDQPSNVVEECLAVGHAEDQLRLVGDAIRQETVAWALGYGDPLRERVEARRQQAAAD